MDIVSPHYLKEKADYIKGELAKIAPLFKWEVKPSNKGYAQYFIITSSIVVSDTPIFTRSQLPLELFERLNDWQQYTTTMHAQFFADELLKWKPEEHG